MGNMDNKTYSDFESAFNSAANNALSVIISSIQQCMDPASKNASLVPYSSIPLSILFKNPSVGKVY